MGADMAMMKHDDVKDDVNQGLYGCWCGSDDIRDDINKKPNRTWGAWSQLVEPLSNALGVHGSSNVE